MFHDVNLPDFLALYAKGGPIFSTNIIQTQSGREVRIPNKYQAIHQYVITDCYLNQKQFEEFNSFFRARFGMTYGFRLKDYSDYMCNSQKIEVDNNNKFQLIKTYSDEISPYTRIITKPIDVKIDMQNDIDYTTGIGILKNPLKNGEKLIATFTFDVPVRFNNEQFKYSFQPDGTIMIYDLLLIEVI